MLLYFQKLPLPKLLLWAYLIWYLYVAARYFDASAALWLTSLGLSAIIGTGLYVSTAFHAGERKTLGFWPTFRFFLMPFCVSSFAALIKGRGFFLILHPALSDNLFALALCLSFAGLVLRIKQSARSAKCAGSSLEFTLTPGGSSLTRRVDCGD